MLHTPIAGRCGKSGITQSQVGGFTRRRNIEVRQYLRCNDALLGEDAHLLNHILQLTYVPRPFVGHHHLLGLWSKAQRLWNAILLSCVHCKFLEQEQHVIVSLTQRRHLHADGAEPIVKILAETTFANGLLYLNVSGSNNAHVGLLGFRTSHRDVFTRFQDTQQSHLCAERQLAHLVEEQSPSVCRSKVSIVITDCSSERPLGVSKQFAVNRSFWNRATVDGKISLCLTRRIVVDDAWNHLLTHTTLSLNEDGEVCRRHLQRSVDYGVQLRVTTYNPIATFYIF